MISIVVLYYSRHGSTQALARQIARGVESVEGCQALLRTVAELDGTASNSDPYLSLDELKQCDGLALGSPVWFGNMAAPLKHGVSANTSLGLMEARIDQPAFVLPASSTLHGGQETTQQSMMLPLLHHGMLILGIPYSEPALHTTQSGGTPYGASHVHQQKTLSSEEAELARQLGTRLAPVAKQLKG